MTPEPRVFKVEKTVTEDDTPMGKKKEKKEQLSKAQKRKLADRVSEYTYKVEATISKVMYKWKVLRCIRSIAYVWQPEIARYISATNTKIPEKYTRHSDQRDGYFTHKSDIT